MQLTEETKNIIIAHNYQQERIKGQKYLYNDLNVIAVWCCLYSINIYLLSFPVSNPSIFLKNGILIVQIKHNNKLIEISVVEPIVEDGLFLIKENINKKPIYFFEKYFFA